MPAKSQGRHRTSYLTCLAAVSLAATFSLAACSDDDEDGAGGATSAPGGSGGQGADGGSGASDEGGSGGGSGGLGGSGGSAGGQAAPTCLGDLAADGPTWEVDGISGDLSSNLTVDDEGNLYYARESGSSYLLEKRSGADGSLGWSEADVGGGVLYALGGSVFAGGAFWDVRSMLRKIDPADGSISDELDVSPADRPTATSVDICHLTRNDAGNLVVVYALTDDDGGGAQTYFRREIRDPSSLTVLETVEVATPPVPVSVCARGMYTATGDTTAPYHAGRLYYPTDFVVDFETETSTSLPNGIWDVDDLGAYYASTATEPNSSNGEHLIWRIVALDPALSLQWTITYEPSVAGDYKDSYPSAMTTDDAGGLYVGGYGERDMFEPFDRVWYVIKIDIATEAIVWAQSVPKSHDNIDAPGRMLHRCHHVYAGGQYNYPGGGSPSQLRFEKRRDDDGTIAP